MALFMHLYGARVLHITYIYSMLLATYTVLPTNVFELPSPSATQIYEYRTGRSSQTLQGYFVYKMILLYGVLGMDTQLKPPKLALKDRITLR